jgi:hypothetical protein
MESRRHAFVNFSFSELGPGFRTESGICILLKHRCSYFLYIVSFLSRKYYLYILIARERGC